MRIFIFIVLAFTGVVLTFQNPGDFREARPKLFPPKNIEHFTFGFRESVADSFWLRLIQDFDFCGRPTKGHGLTLKPSESTDVTMEDKVVFKGMDPLAALEEEEIRPARCRLGWAYEMLDAVTDLSPYIGIAYRIGATILSVLVDDREGAARIYDKGLKYYPNDWSLAYRAAYHQLYELRNFEKAAELLKQAGENGAPIWVTSLAAKLYARAGRLEFGRTVLLDLVKKTVDQPAIHNRALERLKKIEKALAKEVQ